MIRAAAIALFAFACATTPTSPPEASVDPPAQYASLPRYEVGAEMKPPKVLKRVEPVFPHSVMMRKGKFAVTIESVITETGAVQDAWYVSGDKRLIDGALYSVRQWKFEPAVMNGKPIPVRFQLTVTVNSTGVQQPNF